MNGIGRRWLWAFAILAALWAGFTMPERAHAGTPIDIVALGDSLSSGWTIHPRYEHLAEVELHRVAYSANLAVPGRTSAQLLDSVRTDGAGRDALAGAEIVTLQVGINDFWPARASYVDGTCGGVDGQDCLRAVVAGFQANWDAILGEIDALRAPGTIIRAFDLYYAVPTFDQAGEDPPFELLNSYLLAMNDHIHASAATTRDMRVANVHAIFNGPSGADDPWMLGYVYDGVHPNANGGAAIADALAALGYAPLTRACADVNIDRRVNVLDLAMIAKNVGAVAAVYDVNGDNSVNTLDIRIAVRQHGTSCG